MSGRRFAAVVGFAAAAVLTAACGNGVAIEPTGGAIRQIDTATAVQASQGAAITVAEAVATLPASSGEFLQPVAATSAGIVIAGRDASLSPEEASTNVRLWDPETGSESDLWTTPPGHQSIVLDAEGDWLASVDTGIELPFSEWTLVLRNMATGETRTLAQGDPAVADVAGLQPDLPFGFAPAPSLAGDMVAWSQYAPDGDGVRREVHTYDISSGDHDIVARTTPVIADVEWPVLGGGRLAWIERANDGRSTFVVRELESGTERRLGIEGSPFGLALSADGRYLAWDEALTAKYSYDLETGKLVHFGGEEGWGIYGSGTTFSSSPATAYGGKGGYYDTATGTVRWLAPKDGVTTNIASVFGPYFGWQESTEAGTNYYFAETHPQGGPQ